MTRPEGLIGFIKWVFWTIPGALFYGYSSAMIRDIYRYFKNKH